jgi:4-(gamma-glutamylamino)butanal dehydrogenase
MSATPIAISPPHAYIDGAQAAPESGETFETMTPATGQVLAEIAACGPADIDRAVSSARRAFDGGEWSRRAPAERKQVLLRLAELIESNLLELARIDAVDAGKPLVDCEELDLPDVVNTFRWYA